MSTLVAIAYPDEATAGEVSQTLMELQKEHSIELDDLVVAIRNPDGKIKLKQSFKPAASGAPSFPRPPCLSRPGRRTWRGRAPRRALCVEGPAQFAADRRGPSDGSGASTVPARGIGSRSRQCTSTDDRIRR